MSIRPGLNVRIVTDPDVAKERILVKGSTVHDVQEPVIILAQTDPPILKSMLHKEAIITYLEKKKDGVARQGFTAELVEIIDYSLNSGQQTRALVVRRTGPEKPYSIRMSYRVGPTGRSRVSMSVFANSVNIIDISLGGVKFTYGMPLVLVFDEVAPVGLEIDGKAYALEARILRRWRGDNEGARRDLWFASAEFVSMSKTVERVLSRAIHDIERESRLKEA
jgi:hypothetical protein